MLATDAWAFLDIRRPLCAWATYRGVLTTPPSEPGFVSVWTASVMRVKDPRRIVIELVLESHRRKLFPDLPSRLTSLFCFSDLRSAERACGKAGHFRPDLLAELSLAATTRRQGQLDLNWIDYAYRTDGALETDFNWVGRYWSGEPSPIGDPIWETLIQGRAIILGTELRERAYQAIKENFPESLMLLEIARQAAWVDSDLGSIQGFIAVDEGDLMLRFAFDMRDANDPDFLQRLQDLRKSGHPTNWADMKPHLERESFGRVPDLRPFEFRVTDTALPRILLESTL
jgi:hypothetical protein